MQRLRRLLNTHCGRDVATDGASPPKGNTAIPYNQLSSMIQTRSCSLRFFHIPSASADETNLPSFSLVVETFLVQDRH